MIKKMAIAECEEIAPRMGSAILRMVQAGWGRQRIVNVMLASFTFTGVKELVEKALDECGLKEDIQIHVEDS